MGQFQLLAQPLWVNLLVFIPLGLFIGWRRRGLQISGRQFLFATLFALAFGFVEEGREQRQVREQTCDPLDAIWISPLVSKVNVIAKLLSAVV